MNCNGYIDVKFSNYIVINHTTKTKEYQSSENIPVAISVNTDCIGVVLQNEKFTLDAPVAVPNPCDPDDRAKDILVDEVSLNVVRVSGIIGYRVGIDVLESSSNVLFDSFTPLQWASIDSTIEVEYKPLLLNVEDGEEAPDITVRVVELEVNFKMDSDAIDKCYLITGTFRIEPVEPAPQII